MPVLYISWEHLDDVMTRMYLEDSDPHHFIATTLENLRRQPGSSTPQSDRNLEVISKWVEGKEWWCKP